MSANCVLPSQEMSQTFIRNLTFQTDDLGRESTLLLTFDSYTEGIYDKFYPVVWRVSPFGKRGSYSMVATYTSQLAFLKPQVVEGNITEASTCIEINYGQATTLTEAHDVFHFSDPVPGINGCVRAWNNTGVAQDIAVGFMSPGKLMPKPVLHFSGVEHRGKVTAQFTPILRAYITSDYEENTILRGAIDTPCLWKQDLAALHEENTTWNLTRNPSTGHYEITRAY
ncbi:uncharacterized protein EDB91DRAFT_144037 [Suillus paluster]|uniref:uncharacterized protein n=1 Tax=Suillus paluster TaxID=48578 RepID=UPI001B85D5F8|nr:uncharacterized protein EDB91DRAFT_144037 [Suillus paluster]KAG1724082.1 hypothetical protein EDB91DRAFT_144037 [Suillus paluster]